MNIEILLELHSLFEPYTGSYNRDSLSLWVKQELTPPSLEVSPLFPERSLHVISSNTPHAAFQTLWKALLIGKQHFFKLPQNGVDGWEDLYEAIPLTYRTHWETSLEIRPHWLESLDLAIIYGSHNTIQEFRQTLHPSTKLIEHGHRLGIGIITSPSQGAAKRAALDITQHDQKGCLSVHHLYVTGDLEPFAKQLETAFQQYPPMKLTASEAGAVSHFRVLNTFCEANLKDRHLIASPSCEGYTILTTTKMAIEPSPGYRTVILHPYQEPLDQAKLGPESAYLSTVAIEPYEHSLQQQALKLRPTRICALGTAQAPPFHAPHDGYLSLQSLVHWVQLQ